MNPITLPAYFDGEQICLEKPFKLRRGTKLIVTILDKSEVEQEHIDWLNLSKEGLKNAYDDDEIEYSLDLVKRFNPDYEGK